MKTQKAVKGICRDCKYRWQYGEKNKVHHLYCEKRSCKIKNSNMKSCSDYEKADEKTLKMFRKLKFNNVEKK